jgi:methionine synthase II (cobalamin-independent)
MKHSDTRIRTSHVGRLPAPAGWEDMPAKLATGQVTDPKEIAAQVEPAIAALVKRQVETGIDCVNDGEFWTGRNLAHYATHFDGVTVRPVSDRQNDSLTSFLEGTEKP